MWTRDPQEITTSDAPTSAPHAGWKWTNRDPPHDLTTSDAPTSVPQAITGWKETDWDPPQLTTSDAPASAPQASPGSKGTDQDPPQLTTSDAHHASVPQAIHDWEGITRDPPLLTTSDAPVRVAQAGPGLKGTDEDPPKLTTSDELASVPQDVLGWKGTTWNPPKLTTSDAPTTVPQAGRGLKGSDGDPPELTSSDEPTSVPHAGLGISSTTHSWISDMRTLLPITRSWNWTNQDPPQLTTSDAPAIVPQAGPEIAENKVTVGEQEELEIQSDRTEAPIDPGEQNLDPEKPVDLSVAVQEPDQTVITLESPADTPAETESTQLPAGSDTSAAVAATNDGDTQIDIIKSIVYGGLLEAIASLSVVTSAASADAKTLNIVALGVANMLGGLSVLAHNLKELKQETSEERYEEALGRPGHFPLHSVVAVLSYLVFGLLPPAIYGFTFRASDNRDYKLIAVALASLVCIIILALAKSYVRTPPKAYMKTLLYYISLWIMTCGVSYVAGDVIDFLLQKLGLFESSSSVAMPLPVGEFKAVKMPWAYT